MMVIFDYINVRNSLRIMSDEFELFLPKFVNALDEYGFDNF